MHEPRPNVELCTSFFLSQAVALTIPSCIYYCSQPTHCGSWRYHSLNAKAGGFFSSREPKCKSSYIWQIHVFKFILDLCKGEYIWSTENSRKTIKFLPDLTEISNPHKTVSVKKELFSWNSISRGRFFVFLFVMTKTIKVILGTH